ARKRLRLADRKLHAHAVVRLPREAAGPRRLFAIDQEVERRRNADETLDLQAGAFGRQIPDRAVEHRPPLIEQDLAAPARRAAMRVPAFLHGLLPTSGDRVTCIIAPAGCRSVKDAAQFEATRSTLCTARVHGYRCQSMMPKSGYRFPACAKPLVRFIVWLDAS